MKRFLTLLACLSMGCVMAQQAVKVSTNEATQRFNPMVAAVYKEIGLAPTFVPLPPERGLKSLESGEVDADLGRIMGGTAGYQNMVETKEPMFEVSLNAAVAKDFKGGEVGLANLKTFKVGLMRGTKLAEGIAAKMGIEATVANTLPQLFQMLGAGRIDVVLLLSATPLSNFPEFTSTVVVQGKPLMEAKSVHVFGTKLAAYAPKFDAAVKAMKADGRWAKLLSGN